MIGIYKIESLDDDANLSSTNWTILERITDFGDVTDMTDRLIALSSRHLKYSFVNIRIEFFAVRIHGHESVFGKGFQ